MSNKFMEVIAKIMIIKINIFFIIIFSGAMIYSAEMLNNYSSIKELFFWVTIILIIVSKCFYVVHRTLDRIQELIIHTNNVKRSVQVK